MSRAVGYSTGALAKGNVRLGVELQRFPGSDAIELSALRENELPSLVETIPSLDLRSYLYISVHAPSKLLDMSETNVVELLHQIPRSWPLVTHPDVIRSPELWRSFGPQLCIENMDQRKPIGRTADELAPMFEMLPSATFCLDIGHARQIDPTLGVAARFLDLFGRRLRQIHLSQLGPNSEHLGMGPTFREAVIPLLRLIPNDCPVIIESVVEPSEIKTQLDFARDLFSVAAVA